MEKRMTMERLGMFMHANCGSQEKVSLIQNEGQIAEYALYTLLFSKIGKFIITI